MPDNKYLTKIALNQEKDTPGPLSVALPSLIGGAYLHQSAPSLLGYRVLYHGTTKENAKKISETGFNPNLGGTHNSTTNQTFRSNSEGKVHFTENVESAKMYSGNPGKHMPPGRPQEHNPKAMEQEAKLNGKVVKVRVPEHMYKRFAIDGDSSDDLAKKINPEGAKATASTTFNRVPPKFVAGGKGSKGVFDFIDRKRLGAYISSAEGRKRFNRGGNRRLPGRGLYWVRRACPTPHPGTIT